MKQAQIEEGSPCDIIDRLFRGFLRALTALIGRHVDCTVIARIDNMDDGCIILGTLSPEDIDKILKRRDEMFRVSEIVDINQKPQ